VSVIIPCYRQAQYLPLAVHSVVAQTFPDWELVIVDDGSPDETAEVARRLIERHRGRAIRLLRQPNAGLPGARNAGIRAASGRRVLPLDADDALAPTFLARTMLALDGSPSASIAFTDVARFGGAEGVVRMGPWDIQTLAQRNVAVCTSLYDRAVWEAVGGYDENMLSGYEDWDFWLRCAEQGLGAVHVAEPLFFYRYRPESMVLRAAERDKQLRALLVIRHPALHPPDTVRRAGALLAQQADASLACRLPPEFDRSACPRRPTR
jgi:GT2 family glycosyltransferase